MTFGKMSMIQGQGPKSLLTVWTAVDGGRTRRTIRFISRRWILKDLHYPLFDSVNGNTVHEVPVWKASAGGSELVEGLLPSVLKKSSRWFEMKAREQVSSGLMSNIFNPLDVRMNTVLQSC